MQFLGSSISVFGTFLDIEKDSNVDSTLFSFTIDGNQQETQEYPVSFPTDQHVGIFNSTTLTDEPHLLGISYAFDGTNSNFWLDYILYEAADNSSISNTETARIFIDDTSPYLQYSSSNWTPGHSHTMAESTSTRAATFNMTVAQSSGPNATASLTFYGT